MAEIMVAAGNYSVTYARALVMTTSREQLVDPESPKKIPGIHPDDLARIEHEMALTIARGYLRPLLENGRVVRFLSQNFREFLFEFQRIIEAANLE